MNQKFSTKKNEKGQGLVEYALIAALVSLVLVGVLTAFGPEIRVLAIGLVGSVSGSDGGDFKVENGELIIDGISPIQTSTPSSAYTLAFTFTPTRTFTPTATPTPTFTPTPTPTPTATFTSTPTATSTSTPTVLACTSGSQTNVASSSACSLLSENNHCDTSTYNRFTKKCTWPKP
jgi:Flp pilus assembly pilin Flp